MDLPTESISGVKAKPMRMAPSIHKTAETRAIRRSLVSEGMPNRWTRTVLMAGTIARQSKRFVEERIVIKKAAYCTVRISVH